MQQRQVASSSCCSTQLSSPCMGMPGVTSSAPRIGMPGATSFAPRIGMPGVTSLLPGRLQRLQVSLSSSLEVPAEWYLSRPLPGLVAPCDIKDLTCRKCPRDHPCTASMALRLRSMDVSPHALSPAYVDLQTTSGWEGQLSGRTRSGGELVAGNYDLATGTAFSASPRCFHVSVPVSGAGHIFCAAFDQHLDILNRARQQQPPGF